MINVSHSLSKHNWFTFSHAHKFHKREAYRAENVTIVTRREKTQSLRNINVTFFFLSAIRFALIEQLTYLNFVQAESNYSDFLMFFYSWVRFDFHDLDDKNTEVGISVFL